MSISAGLVGLPNVGKSTLFNALTKSSVPAENYPFCTIEPHNACTPVPDPRLENLKRIYNSGKIIASTVDFVDIAGLVKGAASGEGLGNQFLSHIREVNLILHVLRCFEDSNITRAEPIDPLSDFDVINTELALKDLEYIDKRLPKIAQLLKSEKNNPLKLKELNLELEILQNLQPALNNLDLKKVQEIVKQDTIKATTTLLTAKNFLIVANMAESEIGAFDKNPFYNKLIDRFGKDRVIPVSVKVEYELSLLSPEERADMMDMLGLKHSGLDEIIAKSYANLNLITFFTCGPKEIHAWPIKNGITIRQAAGEIHSDLERGFICADIFNYKDLEAAGSEAKVKESGKFRTEGQDYIVKDGDIVNIKFNV